MSFLEKASPFKEIELSLGEHRYGLLDIGKPDH